MKKWLCLSLIFALFFVASAHVFAENETKDTAENVNTAKNESVMTFGNTDISVDAKAAVLMEETTGSILYEKDGDMPLSPASVTKIMTLLLVMEALKEEKIHLSDPVSISANAASMGGSQVFLKEGESFSVEELIKCTVISSANDAALALAEYIMGSEEAFVKTMNERADLLGLKGSHFENVTGLDDTVKNHVMSAKDVAIITRELLKHPKLFEYSSIWQDSIRDGAFTLTNTNRLVRFYDGCTGLKTGSTDEAGFCVTVTANRNGLSLIAVIMGAPTRDIRNQEVRKLLDYGFSHYEVFSMNSERLEQVPIYGGLEEKADLYNEEFKILVPKGKRKEVEIVYDLPEYINAPMAAGSAVGKMIFKLDGEEIGRVNVFIVKDIEKTTYLNLLLKILTDVFCKREIISA